jgi:hypothetical protein
LFCAVTGSGGQPYTLVISATLPPMGFSTFAVLPYFNEPTKIAEDVKLSREMRSEPVHASPLVISNQFLTLAFDATSGLLSSMTNTVSFWFKQAGTHCTVICVDPAYLAVKSSILYAFCCVG